MGLRELLKKKDDLAQGPPTDAETVDRLNTPEVTFIRSDTTSQEQVFPPTLASGDTLQVAKERGKPRRSLDVFRSSRSRSTSASSQNGQSQRESRRISQRLHLSRAPQSSERVPNDLPDILPSSDTHDKDAAELQWEKRATMLASQNERAKSRSTSPAPAPRPIDSLGENTDINGGRSPSRTPRPEAVLSKDTEEGIQEAIRLHEEGDFQRSTAIFGRLADPNGANNPLSQVLYGLALRHGWGCEADTTKAVQYLSAAASNAASIEQLALQAGLKKGGAAKGELVLAIFELANCFRHGWGIEKDAYAAKQYYETAANLGDSDAMNEVAWCYLEGFGCKKDKFAAARYYQLAEKAGNKTLGNTWIWKDKYNPSAEGGRKKK